MAPKVFVITLNWNGKRWLEDFLATVLAIDYPIFEVVMVSNGSTERSVAFVRLKFPLCTLWRRIKTSGMHAGLTPA